jgi:predicted nucleic acid-binding protein
MNASVVDASAVAAILFDEPCAEQTAARLGASTLVAPALLEYELGNVCWKKCRRHPEQAEAIRKSLRLFAALEVQLHDVNATEVLELAHRVDVSFYDASYLWLARQLGLPLVTLDKRLQQAIQ